MPARRSSSPRPTCSARRERPLRDVTKEAKALGIEPVRAGGRAPAAWARTFRAGSCPSSLDPACGRQDARIEANEDTPARCSARRDRPAGRAPDRRRPSDADHRPAALLHRSCTISTRAGRSTAVLDVLDDGPLQEGLDAHYPRNARRSGAPPPLEVAAALNRLDSCASPFVRRRAVRVLMRAVLQRVRAGARDRRGSRGRRDRSRRAGVAGRRPRRHAGRRPGGSPTRRRGSAFSMTPRAG